MSDKEVNKRPSVSNNVVLGDDDELERKLYVKFAQFLVLGSVLFGVVIVTFSANFAKNPLTCVLWAAIFVFQFFVGTLYWRWELNKIKKKKRLAAPSERDSA